MRPCPERLGRLAHILFYVAAFIGFFLFMGPIDRSWAQNAYRLEYQFKASFLTNFARLITWPDEIAERHTLNLCILDPSPFGQVLASIQGKVVMGKKLVVTVCKKPSDAIYCQILFANSDDAGMRRRFIEAVRGKPVVIVGETPGFARSEGMINFITRNKKIRFEINRSLMESAGLRASSRLLKYGIAVEEPKKKQAAP